MADQVLAQNSLITSSFATALGETTASIETAFTGWTTTFSAQQSTLTTQSNQLFTDFTLQLLTQSTTLTESLIARRRRHRRLEPRLHQRSDRLAGQHRHRQRRPANRPLYQLQ